MRRRSDVSGAWQTVGDAWEPPVLAIAFLGALPKQSLQILEVDAVKPDGVVIRVLGGRLHLRLGEEETELAPGGWVRMPARLPHTVRPRTDGHTPHDGQILTRRPTGEATYSITELHPKGG